MPRSSLYQQNQFIPGVELLGIKGKGGHNGKMHCFLTLSTVIQVSNPLAVFLRVAKVSIFDICFMTEPPRKLIISESTDGHHRIVLCPDF